MNQLLTPQQVADEIGCSKKHVYELINDGALRAVDISRPEAQRSKTRIRADDLAIYINQHPRDVRAA